MKSIRIIKKYPNRRLYDTEISSYITLADVKKLVMNSVAFKVIDAKTESDLTSSTLLQIIAEQEEHNKPIFSTQLLQQLIRFYGHSMQHTMGQFLEQSMNLFIQQQENVQKKFGKLLSEHPLQAINEITQENMAFYKQWQNHLSHYLKEKGQV